MGEENQEQIEYWNDRAGATWTEMQERLDAMLAPISNEVIKRLGATSGEQILDVGCGCGDTSIAIHEAGASVVGVDISAPMLARARSRSSSVEFIEADAANHKFTTQFDAVFSRFGVMFFAEPNKAFKNLRGALKPDGRLQFVCWQPPQHNPWMSITGRAVQRFLSQPDTKPDPKAPGPFVFAEPAYVQEILTQAGFNNIEVQSYTCALKIANTLSEAIVMQTKIGPAARALVELEPAQRNEALQAVEAVLAEHSSDAGIALDSAVWMVSATA